jgi:hypothetical protein
MQEQNEILEESQNLPENNNSMSDEELKFEVDPSLKMLEDDQGGIYDPKMQRYHESVHSSLKSSIHESVKKFKESLKSNELHEHQNSA